MLTVAGIELFPAWPVFLGFVVAQLAANFMSAHAVQLALAARRHT